jgi:predicted amidohydrolase/NH3-dependent NAD+ synthetase
MNKNIKISLNQINTVTGDIKGNYSKILDLTHKAISDGADIIVFPETSVTGYCVGSLWDNVDFIFEQENCIKDLIKIIPHDKALIIGYISYHGAKPDGFPLLRNSVAVINQNKLQRYDKQLLANADHHEDRKYFKPGKKSKVFELHLKDGETLKVGVPICEDAWYMNHFRNIPKEMINLGAEILIIPNQSYFYYGKDLLREKLFSTIANEYHIPVITLNSVGIGDIVKNIIIYDGSSMVFNENGEKLRHFKKFGEQSDIIDLFTSKSSLYHNEYFENYTTKPKFEEIIDAICFEQKEMFRLLGIKKAQVHLSGGIDSIIVAVLCILSMGKENCVFITNPTSLNTKSLKLVHKMVKTLGVDLYTDELDEIVNALKKADTKAFGETTSKIQGEIETVFHAVGRTVQGLAATHRFGSGIVATGNHTEIVLGWCNFHDIGSIGVHSIIGDLTKLELYQLSQVLNDKCREMYNGENVIPEELFNGKVLPAADLPDSKLDPFDYYIQSGLCAAYIRERKSRNQLIEDFKNHRLNPDFFPSNVYEKYTMEQFIKEVEITMSRSRTSVFKAAQHAPIVILSPRSRGFSNRETILNKYIS